MMVIDSVKSALSLGTGYEPTPLGDAWRADELRGYPLDFRAKTALASGQELNPVTVAQFALGRWERHLDGEVGALSGFQDAAQRLRDLGELDDGVTKFPYHRPLSKYRLNAPWYSAMAQGQAASVFARAWDATGDESWRDLCNRAVGPLLGQGQLDLVVETDSGPVLEEAPSDPPSHILNGWIFALWGLRDAALVGNSDCGFAYERGIAALGRMLPAYDTGRWSLYSLYPHAIADLAKPFYHRLHVAQLTALDRMAAGSVFALLAERWRRYDRLARPALVVAHKSAFTATRRLIR